MAMWHKADVYEIGWECLIGNLIFFKFCFTFLIFCKNRGAFCLCPLELLLCEGLFFPSFFVVILKMIFMSGNQAKILWKLQDTLLDFLT